MKQNRIMGLLVLAALAGMIVSWEDRPDVEDHKDTDRMLKDADCALRADEYLLAQIQKEQDEDLQHYKTSQFKWKKHENFRE